MNPAEAIASVTSQHYLDQSRVNWEGDPLCCCGASPDDWDNHWAEAAVDALAGAGQVVASTCGCGQPIGTCDSCSQPRCWHCNPGLGKHYAPMKCNERHAPARPTLPEETTTDG